MNNLSSEDLITIIDRAQGIEEIAGSVAHEVRNPMAVVSGSLSVMRWKEDLAPYTPQFRSMIREIERAMDLLGEFIQITRPKVFEPLPGNLNDIIESIKELLSADAAVHHHAIAYELEPLEDILIDGKCFCQVILNLVRNALESMSLPSKTVTVKTFMEDDKVCFSVTDQGSGFPPCILENWGEPFKTTKANGSGLGLAACRSIAQNHGAQMKVHSGEGGSTVQITFKPISLSG